MTIEGEVALDLPGGTEAPADVQTDSAEEDRRNYGARMVPLQNWLLEQDVRRITITQVQEHFGWNRKAAAQALYRLANTGVLKRLQPGVYEVRKPKKTKADEPEAPESPAPTAPFEVVDGVLAELFPNGIPVANLAQVIAWRESTRALLRLTQIEDQ